MTQEEKILVLQDISGRLLYDVVIHTNLKDIRLDKKHRYIGVLYYEDYSKEFKKSCNYDTNHFSIIVSGCHYGDIKPYLRPMSSITPEEDNELSKMLNEAMLNAVESGETGFTHKNIAHNRIAIDFFNKKMLDYRGLIPMGLALEAPEDMYKFE